MRITYDQDTDALYIRLYEAAPVDSEDLDEGVTVDLDARGTVVGVEILDASELAGTDPLADIAFERFEA